MVPGKGWSFRNCNSFPHICNQAASKHVSKESTHHTLLSSHSRLQLDYAKISSPDIFCILLFHFSVVSKYICIFKCSNSNLKYTSTKKKKKSNLYLVRNTGVARFELRCRDLSVVVGALWTRQQIALDFTKLLLNRILKSNIFHRCLHLVTAFWKIKTCLVHISVCKFGLSLYNSESFC